MILQDCWLSIRLYTGPLSVRASISNRREEGAKRGMLLPGSRMVENRVRAATSAAVDGLKKETLSEAAARYSAFRSRKQRESPLWSSLSILAIEERYSSSWLRAVAGAADKSIRNLVGRRRKLSVGGRPLLRFATLQSNSELARAKKLGLVAYLDSSSAAGLVFLLLVLVDFNWTFSSFR